MAAYIKFLAGYLAGDEYRYVRRNKLLCHNKIFGGEKLHLSDFKSIDVASEENLKKIGGTFGGAIIGGALLGGAGLVAGALTGGNTKESMIICEFKNGQKALAKANSPMMEAISIALFNAEHNPGMASGGKPKISFSKFLLILLALFIVVEVFSVLGNRTPAEKSVPAASATSTEKKDPCENIKTMDDWNNKTSTLWRAKNPQCKP